MALAGLIRLIHGKHYDKRRKRFTSLAFKNSEGGGISVILGDCVDASRRSICQHIRTYYPARIAGEPPIYWEFPQSILPAEKCVEPHIDPAITDPCHANIERVCDSQAKQLLPRDLAIYQICVNGKSRGLTEADLFQY